MENIKELSTRILSNPFYGTDKITGTSFSIESFTTEFASICKNIKETSFSEDDRITRCKKLANESGIDFFQIKKLTA